MTDQADPTDDTARLNALRHAPDMFAALDRVMAEVIGHKLFTLMVIDRDANEAARVYSSDPDAYAVKGRKPLGDLTEWGAQVIDRGEPYIGYDAADIRSVFFDHETIAALGCASVLNMPVFADGRVIGTMNLLHEARWYRPEHAQRCAPYAALLTQPYLDWVASSRA